MASAILNQGKTAIRDALKNLFSHGGVSTNNTAFNATQNELNPGGTGTNLIKTSTKTDVDASTFDSVIAINGDTEFTGLQIWTIGPLKGATAADAIARTVRSVSVGVQAGDLFDVGVRVQVQDAS